MRFTLIESLSLPSDAARPNEDAFSNTENFAAVLDGATGLGEQLMPGPSDAQWIARFGANRLASHARSGMGGPRDWLRHAMADARKSFEALRRRPPNETYEIAFASIMAATLRDDVLQTLWLGDCSALLCDRDGGVRLLGDAQNARERERARVASIMLGQGGDPAAISAAMSDAALRRRTRMGRAVR